MNKLFNKIATGIVGIALAIGVGVAVVDKGSGAKKVIAAETTWEITAMTGSYSTSGGSVDLSNGSKTISWSYGTSKYIGLNGSKIQVGSKNNPQTSNWTLSTNISNFGTNKKITSVSLTAYTTATEATYNIFVGGTSQKSGSLTTSSAKYTANNLNVTSGAIEFTIKGSSSSKAMYVCGLSVTYDDAVTPSSFTVAYNANGGEGNAPTDSNSPYSSGATVTVLGNVGSPALTKFGYSFNGWNESAEGTGTSRAVGSTFSISENKTLYAVWSPKTLTGLITVDGTPDTTTYTNAQSFDPTGLVIHAEFNSTEDTTKNIATDIVWGSLTAGVNTVTGTYTHNSVEKNVTISGLTVTEAPIKTFLPSDFSTTAGDQSSSKGVITLRLSSGCQNATLPDFRAYAGSTTTVSASTGYRITKIVIDSTGVASGRTCSNYSASTGSYSTANDIGTWTGEAQSIVFSNSTQVQMISMVVTYEIIVVNCSVTYDGNDATSGNAPTDGTTYTSGQTVTVLGNVGSPALAKTSYTFLGWSTSSSASSAEYVAGNTFTILTDTTLYAVWQENDYIEANAASYNVKQNGGTLDLTTCVTVRGTGALSFTALSNPYFSISGTTLTSTTTTGGPITVTGHKGSETATFDVYVIEVVDFTKFTGTFDEGTYVLTYNNGAVTNTISSSRADITSVSPVSDVISNPDDSIVWEIEEVTVGAYTGYSIYNAKVGKYLASTTSQNQAALVSPITDKCVWLVSGSTTYEFTNANPANSTNKYLRRNGSLGFACYSTSIGGTLTIYAAPAVDRLKSIEVVGATSTFKDGDKFAFNGSVTATYSISGTTGHTGITTGLSFKVGNADYIPGTTELSRGSYTVVVTYNDGTKTASVNWPITVGYHDATSVVIDSASEITVSKGYDTTFTATVNPSNADPDVTWSVTDLEGEPTSLADIDPDTGYFLASDSESGDVKITATSKDNLASASIIVHISDDPILVINHSSANLYYPLDATYALSVSPENFPTGTVTYEWGSNATSVVTISSSTSSATANIIGAGNATVTATAKIGDTTIATATCEFNITKTRSVLEDIISSSSYDFSSVSYDSTALDDGDIAVISNCFNEDTIAEPTVTIGNYVYAGNGSGGAYENQGGFIKLGKSGTDCNGTLTFNFGETTITKVVVKAQTWNGTEGKISINGTEPSTNAGASSYADVERSGLSATEIVIQSNKRVFVKSITFYSEQSGQQIGRTTDVVDLETFITNNMHMSDYTTEKGWCSDDEHHYYFTAKTAFNSLNAHQKSLFTGNSAYTAEYARLCAWARANGEAFDSSTQTFKKAKHLSIFNASLEATTATSVVIIVSIISIAAVGGYFFLRKKKED